MKHTTTTDSQIVRSTSLPARPLAARRPLGALATAAALASVLPAGQAGAQITFEHHYISTTFPRLNGFGQSVAGDFNRDGRADYLIGQHYGTR